MFFFFKNGFRVEMRCVELRQNVNECPAFALILLGKLKWLWNISGCLLRIKYSSFRYLWKSRGPWWNHVFFKNGFLEEMRCVELRQNVNECPAFALTLLGKLTWLWNISGCLLGIKYSSFRYLWKNRGPWWNYIFFQKWISRRNAVRWAESECQQMYRFRFNFTRKTNV